MANEIPVCAPCPNCGEGKEGIVRVKAGSVGHMQCTACGHMGPGVIGRKETADAEWVAAAVHAWNAVPR